MGNRRILRLFCLWLWCLYGGAPVVMAEENGVTLRELYETPTWAVAAVCSFFIVVSVLLEKGLHKVGTVFRYRHKKALLDALEKVKSELMILGFISLLLTFGQSYILKICIPTRAANTMLPCPTSGENDEQQSEEKHRKLLWLEHRFLSEDSTATKCEDGYEQLITSKGLHQLHILIFFLAVFHVVYSFVTMMLGRLKCIEVRINMFLDLSSSTLWLFFSNFGFIPIGGSGLLQIRGWKSWEQETSSHDYEFSTDPSRFRLTHETSFVRAHTSFWTRIPFFFYVGCFFRQFFRSVGKVDYLTLRNGFIAVHLAPGSKFNFQKYIKRSLEDDFKLVVGVSPILWATFVIFLLLNIQHWRTLFWASALPVIIILAVGTKLQAILTKMALEITDRHAVVQGIPLVQGSDKYFWFGRPQLLLHLIHFALFQNAFQITYFFWIWYSFRSRSCYHANFKLAILKVSIAVGVLCLCSYITLPLYALVTQMGTRMKRSIFDEQTSKALKEWHMTVKKKKKKQSKTGNKLSTVRLGGGDGSSISPTGSTVRSSSGKSLRRFKTTGHTIRSSSTYDDHDLSDLETDTDPLSPKSPRFDLVVNVEPGDQETETHSAVDEPSNKEDEFSFAKPAHNKE